MSYSSLTCVPDSEQFLVLSSESLPFSASVRTSEMQIGKMGGICNGKEN